MGSGKSTYGKKLAKALGYEFVDLDTKIEEEIGKSISDWFANDGEEAFREKEAEVLRTFASAEKTVMATGGGAACFHGNMDWMNENGFTVYLKLLEPQLFKRLNNAKEERPLITENTDKDLQLFIHEMLNERSKYYCAAQLIIQPEQFQPKYLVEYLEKKA